MLVKAKNIFCFSQNSVLVKEFQIKRSVNFKELIVILRSSDFYPIEITCIVDY